MEKKKTNPGGISDAELKTLVTKYPDLQCASIEDLKNKGSRLVFYYIVPTADDWSRASAIVMDKDFKAARTYYHTHCMIWQDPSIAGRDDFEDITLAIGHFIGKKYLIAEGKDEVFTIGE